MKILPRDNLSLHDYVKRHYYQHEVYKRLYDSGDFTDYELMYIFPNNVLRRLGFPMKHGRNKHCEYYRRIHDWQFFNIIEDTIEDIFNSVEPFGDKKWFNKFVPYKNIR